MWRASAAIHHKQCICCFAFHWSWELYSEWFSTFRMFQLIKLFFAHHNLLHQLIRNLRQHYYCWTTSLFSKEIMWVLSGFSIQWVNSASLIGFFDWFSCSWFFHNSPEFKNLFVTGSVMSRWRRSDWGKCFNLVEDFVWQWHVHSCHLTVLIPKPNCGIYLQDGIMTDQSIKEDVTVRSIHQLLRIIFSAW